MLRLSTDSNYCFYLFSIVDLGFQMDLSDAVIGFNLHYWDNTLNKIVDSNIKKIRLIALHYQTSITFSIKGLGARFKGKVFVL